MGCRKGQVLMICARRLSPRDRGPGEDAAITCMEGISVPHRESRAHLGSRGSPVPLDCMRPDGAWAHACCRHGECAMGVGHKDLGRLHGHAPFVALFRMVPRRWSRSNIVSRRLRLQTGRKTRISAANLDLSYPVFLSPPACLLSIFHAPAVRCSVRLNHERAGYGPYAADTRRPRRRSTHDRSTGPAPGPPAGRKAKFAHLKRTCGPNGGRRTSFIAHRPQRVSEGATKYNTGIILADKLLSNFRLARFKRFLLHKTPGGSGAGGHTHDTVQKHRGEPGHTRYF